MLDVISAMEKSGWIFFVFSNSGSHLHCLSIHPSSSMVSGCGATITC